MPLVRRFTTANAIPQPKVPWYEPVGAYALLLPGVLTWFVGGPVFLSYWSCAGSDDARCAASNLLDSSTGSYTGILASAAVLYFLAVLFAVTTQLAVRKLFFPLVWSTAFVSTATSVIAYGIMSGLVGTPWGHLIPGT